MWGETAPAVRCSAPCGVEVLIDSQQSESGRAAACALTLALAFGGRRTTPSVDPAPTSSEEEEEDEEEEYGLELCTPPPPLLPLSSIQALRMCQLRVAFDSGLPQIG